MKYRSFLLKMTSENAWKAFLILISGLFLTIIAALYTERNVESHAETEFALVCNEIITKIDIRLHAHAQLLRSGASLFAVLDTVTRNEWKVFFEHSELSKNLPGIQGVGYACIIQKIQLQRHIQKIRNEGFPGYTIKPAGSRDLYTSIIYLEPFRDRNLRAFGYDMYTEPVRRKAMEYARDCDLAALSGKVILVQETGKDLQAGTLMYVPVYRNGMPTFNVEERRAAIIGWVYSPCRMSDLMQGVLGRWGADNNSRIHLQVFDDDLISANSLLFDSQKNNTMIRQDKPIRTYTIPIGFNGKKWTLLFSQSKEHFSDKLTKVFVITGGVVISLLLSTLSLLLFNTQYRARKIAERLTSELTESEYRFSLFMDYLPAMVFLKDHEGRTLFVNKYMDRVLGASAWLGKTMTDVFPNEFGKQMMADDLKVLKSGYQKKEERIVQLDGKKHYFETHKFTISRSGLKSFLGGVSIDITDRKQAEEALHESDERYKLLLEQKLLESEERYSLTIDALNDGLWDWNIPTGKAFFSSNYYSLLEYDNGEFPAGYKSWRLLVHPDDLAQVEETLQLNIEGGNGFAIDFRMKLKSGQWQWVCTRGKVVEWDENGKAWRMVGTLSDITYRKQAEAEIKLKNEELVNLNAEKDRFFSIIAHDLRSPFQTFLGFTKMMAEDLPNIRIDELQKIALTMRNSATNLFRLLENLLEWSRMEQGLIPYNPVLIRLRSFVEESLTSMDETAKMKGIEITADIPDDLEIYADNNQVQTVLRNLISNAVKFTPGDGKINILAKADGNKSVEISVRDTGIGMSPPMVENLFRLDANMTRKGTAGEPSSGLGLILCKEFVEKQGGKIWVKSEEGKGSTFYIQVPGGMTYNNVVQSVADTPPPVETSD